MTIREDFESAFDNTQANNASGCSVDWSCNDDYFAASGQQSADALPALKITFNAVASAAQALDRNTSREQRGNDSRFDRPVNSRLAEPAEEFQNRTGSRATERPRSLQDSIDASNGSGAAPENPDGASENDARRRARESTKSAESNPTSDSSETGKSGDGEYIKQDPDGLQQIRERVANARFIPVIPVEPVNDSHSRRREGEMGRGYAISSEVSLIFDSYPDRNSAPTHKFKK